MKEETITIINEALRSKLYQEENGGYANYESKNQNVKKIKLAIEDFTNLTNKHS